MKMNTKVWFWTLISLWSYAFSQTPGNTLGVAEAVKVVQLPKGMRQEEVTKIVHGKVFLYE